MDEKNRRLIMGGDIVYPITKQENVIGLQKTITDKMVIVSPTQPQTNYVEKQVWIDTSDLENENESEIITTPLVQTRLNIPAYFEDDNPGVIIEEENIQNEIFFPTEADNGIILNEEEEK